MGKSDNNVELCSYNYIIKSRQENAITVRNERVSKYQIQIKERKDERIFLYHDTIMWD